MHHLADSDKTPSTGLAKADMNGDGKLDLIVSRRNGPSALYLSDANSPARPIPLPIQGNFRQVVALDANQDGHEDLFFGAIGIANPLLLGDGRGNFKVCAELGIPDGRTYAVASADVDKDGNPDLITGNDNQDNLLLRNLGRGCEFSMTPLPLPNSDVYDIQTGDLTGDGFVDLIFSISGAPNQILINRPAD